MAGRFSGPPSIRQRGLPFTPVFLRISVISEHWVVSNPFYAFIEMLVWLSPLVWSSSFTSSGLLCVCPITSGLPLSTALLAFQAFILDCLYHSVQNIFSVPLWFDFYPMGCLEVVSLIFKYKGGFFRFRHMCSFVVMKTSSSPPIILLGFKPIWSDANKITPAFSRRHFLCLIFKVSFLGKPIVVLSFFFKSCLTFFVF